MQVFKAFLKIVKQNAGIAIVYMSLFIFISILSGNSGENINLFEQVKAKIAIVNNDVDSEITEGLKSALAKDNEIVEIDNTKESMQDALFYRIAEYIAIIPKGFTESFNKDKEIKIEKMAVADSYSDIYVDMLINKYLNNVRLYSKYMQKPELSYAELAIKDLDKITNVKFEKIGTRDTTPQRMDMYFQYSSYAIIAIILFCVSSFMMKFNKEELRKRTNCSPLKNRSINFQIFLGITLLAMAIWLVIIAIGAILYGGDIFTIKGALHMLNLLVYTIFCTVLAFLIGSIVKSDFALTGIVNVISLVFSFLGGVFVPQSMLGNSVIFIGSFTPTFWFIKAINGIVTAPNYTMNNLNLIFGNMLIVGGFALAVLAISLVVTKQSKKNN